MCVVVFSSIFTTEFYRMKDVLPMSENKGGYQLISLRILEVVGQYIHMRL